jgi:hypothetical protein
MKALGLVLYWLLFSFLSCGLVIPCADPAQKPVIQFQGYTRTKKAKRGLQGHPGRGKRRSGAISIRPPGVVVVLDRARVAVIL